VPDGQRVLTAGCADGRLQLWDVSGSRVRVTQNLLPDPRATPTCAAFAPNGAFVAAGTRERQVLEALLHRSIVGLIAVPIGEDQGKSFGDADFEDPIAGGGEWIDHSGDRFMQIHRGEVGG